jgi:lipopolysaccharide transport system ATP-binding protein
LTGGRMLGIRKMQTGRQATKFTGGSPMEIHPQQHSAGMDDEVLVRVEGVSKKFCRSLKKSLWYGLCDVAGELSLFTRREAKPRPHGAIDAAEPELREGEFWAVKDCSFELRRGECLGLIGHNGAGKTTLLKMLNGLIKPDTGRIEIDGRVGALIALGAGFNPILTGRENIYINGAVLGLTRKEVDDNMDKIIDFAEIRESIDMPVQSYSSGMAVRLGFAVASHLRPDVLILDEVLAVGDIRFVIKCLNRLKQLAGNAAVILVSHNMQQVSSFCSRVILMGQGQAVLDTVRPAEAIDRYYDLIHAESSESGTGEARVLGIVLDRGDVVRHGEKAELFLSFEVAPSCEQSHVQIYVTDQSMVPVVCMPVTQKDGQWRCFDPGCHNISLPLGVVDLASGKYSFTVLITDKNSKRSLVRAQGLHAFRVYAERSHWGKIVRPVVAS